MPSTTTVIRRLGVVFAATASLALVASVDAGASGPATPPGLQVHYGGVSAIVPASWVDLTEAGMGVGAWGDARDASTVLLVYPDVPYLDPQEAAAAFTSSGQATDPGWRTADLTVTTVDGRAGVTQEFSATGLEGTLWATTGDDGHVVVVVLQGAQVPAGLDDQVGASLTLER